MMEDMLKLTHHSCSMKDVHTVWQWTYPYSVSARSPVLRHYVCIAFNFALKDAVVPAFLPRCPLAADAGHTVCMVAKVKVSSLSCGTSMKAKAHIQQLSPLLQVTHSADINALPSTQASMNLGDMPRANAHAPNRVCLATHVKPSRLADLLQKSAHKALGAAQPAPDGLSPPLLQKGPSGDVLRPLACAGTKSEGPNNTLLTLRR